jgi:hypothetical protein
VRLQLTFIAFLLVQQLLLLLSSVALQACAVVLTIIVAQLCTHC